MNLLSVSNLSKLGREEPLFTGVTFGLDEGDKASIIGKNGTGKSTLLNTIAGVLQPDEGTVTLNKEAGVSYLPQNPVYNEYDSIRDHIYKSHSPKLEIIRQYEDVCAQMETDSSVGLQNKFQELTSKIEKDDLWNYESQVRSILTTLGITDMDRKMGELSGGMIKKVTLAQVLVEDTKLLLLDEPTNHLDITTISWLQDYLAETKRSVPMVTHDRYFLDAVCTNIYELSHHTVKLYQGNYSTYLEKKATEAEIAQNTDRRIEAVLRVERDWLMRGPCARGTKAKARIQHDNELINREKFSADKGFTFEVAGRRLGGKILELHNISKNFPKGFAGATGSGNSAGSTTPVLKNFSYTFNKGEKIGVFGDNGTGKSTLLNIITGAIQPDSGEIIKGVNTVFAYYQQNPIFENTNLTVLEYIKETAEVITMNDGTSLSASMFLDEFGFDGKIQYSPVSSLSGGERKRLFLVRLLMTNPNFLIFDEPTNDFDIFTMNILEQFLTGYQGCLLIVSHDRYFMDKVADTLFILENDGSVSGYVGKCSQYIEYRKEKRAEAEAAERAERNAERAKQNANASSANNSTNNSSNNTVNGTSQTGTTSSNGPSTSNTSSKPRRRTFKEQKEFEAVEKEIADLEEKKTLYENEMASSDYNKSAAAGQKYSEVSAQLEKDYARWEELAALSE